MKQRYPQLWQAYDTALLYLMLAFVAAHLANHLALAFGQDTHIAMMDALRVVYRSLVIEILLLWAIFRQVLAGFRQMRRFGPLKSKGRFRVLVWSGIYLIGFLAIHISAVGVARYWMGLDSNLHFGAAGFHVWPVSLFMQVYYFLAVFTAFAHFGAVVWLRKRASAPVFADRVYRVSLALGVGVAVLINLLMSGVLSDIIIPDAYLATYR